MTKTSFNEQELKLLLTTALKIRALLFNCIEFNIDPHSVSKSSSITEWVGKRGTNPILKDAEKLLALIRLHVNDKDTLQLYEVMDALDLNTPKL